MKKMIYLIKKFFGFIILIIAIILILVMIFDQKFAAQQATAQHFIMYVLVVLFIIGTLIYPFRFKYCSCGRKYSSKSYEYVETKKCSDKTKGKIQTTPYQHKINIVYFCEHCNKEHKHPMFLDGGYTSNNLESNDYEDKKITYEEALSKFMNSKLMKK